MTEEWRAFARSIEEDLEPPTSGEWGRHIMEILFAAERSSITGQQITLASGTRYNVQTTGQVISQKHGWA